ncbi:MAG: hypothetical protein L0G93_00070 [Acinetobacter sp.]|nr:hypothetical protein [Acinetobacter sp.]MDN5646697.1 hypothetical protein [Acinetobacter sp.]
MMDIKTSDGGYAAFEITQGALTPAQLYAEWCSAYGVLSTGSDLQNLDGDDEAYLVTTTVGAKIRAVGDTNVLGFSSEGMLEFYRFTPTIGARSIITIPGISRMYTCLTNTPRMGISFHPPSDSGSSGVRGRRLNENFIMTGTIVRGASQSVDFALKINYGEGFTLALKTSNGASAVPIYAFEIGIDNSSISKQMEITQIRATDTTTTIVNCTYAYGYLSGTVVDEAGLPAQRTIREYDRATGMLLAETKSGVDGSYILPAYTDDEMYVLALDDDIEPSLNALIFDRIKLDN